LKENDMPWGLCANMGLGLFTRTIPTHLNVDIPVTVAKSHV